MKISVKTLDSQTKVFTIAEEVSEACVMLLFYLSLFIDLRNDAASQTTEVDLYGFLEVVRLLISSRQDSGRF